MADSVKIGSIETKPGEKTCGFLKVAELPSMKVTMPLMVVNGVNQGPTVCITAGVHSAEWAGIEAATRTYHQIDPATLSGTLLIVPVVNTIGFQVGTIPYVNPLDNLNLYHIFPGASNGSISHRMIHTLFTKVILHAQFHIDCHGGDIGEDLPFYCNFAYDTGNMQVDDDAKLMARLYTDKYIYPFRNTSGFSCWEVAKRGIPSIVGEGGAMGNYKEENIQYHINGIQNILKHLEMLEGQAKLHDPIVFTEMTDVMTNRGGVFHPFVDPGEQVKEGQRLGLIKNIFGKEVEAITAPTNGVIKVIFRKRVKYTGDIAFTMWKMP